MMPSSSIEIMPPVSVAQRPRFRRRTDANVHILRRSSIGSVGKQGEVAQGVLQSF